MPVPGLASESVVAANAPDAAPVDVEPLLQRAAAGVSGTVPLVGSVPDVGSAPAAVVEPVPVAVFFELEAPAVVSAGVRLGERPAAAAPVSRAYFVACPAFPSLLVYRPGDRAVRIPASSLP